MTHFTCSNDPNPARLIESLRHIGYSNYEAVADLVDNSLDAEATLIQISVAQSRGDYQISIADNGNGMDRHTLDEALKLGSLTERDETTDLGKFGMGLVTASLSMSRCTTVITKQAGEFCTSIADVDEIKKQDKFCKHYAPSSDEEKTLFGKLLGDVPSGTVVVLSKTDHMHNTNVTQFANILRKHLGEVHRYFIRAGKVIRINDQDTVVVDPLQLDDVPKTEIYSDDSYPIEVNENGRSVTENIRVRIALIPEDSSAGELDVAKALQHQGFYVLRNNRQIFRAESFGFFTKHNDFNRMRGEIFFSGKLDRHVGIEFTKRQVRFDQSIQDKLGEHLRGQCSTIKHRMAHKNISKSSDELQLFHTQASKAITEKSRLLINPKATIEKRGPKTTHRGTESSIDEPKRERKNFKESQRVDANLRCRFVEQALGPNGQIFECDQEGKTIIIRWNTDHAFYQRFVMDNQSDGRLITAVDFLVYSMACAELRAKDEENVQFINNMKAVISANLRTLLS